MNDELLATLVAAAEMGTEAHVALSVGYRIALTHLLNKYGVETAFELPEPLAGFIADLTANSLEAYSYLAV